MTQTLKTITVVVVMVNGVMLSSVMVYGCANPAKLKSTLFFQIDMIAMISYNQRLFLGLILAQRPSIERWWKGLRCNVRVVVAAEAMVGSR